MGDIRIRNLTDAEKFSIKASAKSLGMTMEEYIRDLMRKDIAKVRHRILTEARKGAKAAFKKTGRYCDSTAGIRAERDKRW